MTTSPTRLLIIGNLAHATRPLHEASRSKRYSVVGHISDMTTLASFDKAEVMAFIAMDQTHLNQDRLSAYMAVKRAGFRIASIVSDTASVAEGVKLRDNVFIDAGVRLLGNANIGANTWIHAGSEIGARARLGTSSWIGEGCAIGDDVILGKNCTLGRGVVIAHGVTLPAWSFIGKPMTLNESPATPIFTDGLFRAPVVLRG